MFGIVLETIARVSLRERLLARHRAQGEGGMTGTEDKLAAVVDAVRALVLVRAPHALIGGVAVGIRSGIPRATLDVDLAVHSSCDRSTVRTAMTAAGFRFVGEHPHSTNFRHGSGEPVQLAFDPQFDPMIERADALHFGGVDVPVVSTADLLELKRRAAADPARRRSKRLRDEADIALLEGDVPDPDEGW